jgi:2-dehydro-3-deoxyglucarate aldolase/4-hydroxy-2-oxoheptanedioate aldolase
VQKNLLKAKLKAGGTVSGPIINEARSVSTVKMMAVAGHDFLFIDMEHAMFDWETVFNLVQFALLTNICPLVRVTDLQYPLVARGLDTGALGIIIPRVENQEQVEQAVSFAKYPPLGRRGAGGEGRNAYERLNALQAVETSNAESMVVVQIESQEGINNLEGIASVPGLDVVCVGPQDLSISLGVHGDFSAPVFIEAIEQIVATCTPHGVAVGMVEREAAQLERWHNRGCRFLVCNAESNMIYQSASRDVEVLRSFTST